MVYVKPRHGAALQILSYAKINLTLKILGIRSDGFHELETIMQTVSLHDTLTFTEIPSGIEISCSNPIIPVNEKNICHKAASLIIREHNITKGIQINILKIIPSEAGLGGGSSNAAATLVALNQLWNLNLSQEELVGYASRLGSDVAFFMYGGRALCKGRGEIIEKIPNPNDQIPKRNEYFIIIKPDVSVSTKWAYDQFDKIPNPKSQIPTRNENQIFNDLEAVAITKYPIIGEIKEDLIKAGCVASQMTGSGSAVFGIIEDESIADDVFNEIKIKYGNSFLVKPINVGVS